MDFMQFLNEIFINFKILLFFKGDEKIAKALIQNGANVNLENSYKETPLHIAVFIGKLKIRFIFQLKHNQNQKNEHKFIYSIRP